MSTTETQQAEMESRAKNLIDAMSAIEDGDTVERLREQRDAAIKREQKLRDGLTILREALRNPATDAPIVVSATTVIDALLAEATR